MLTRSSEYALRALICLAQHEADWPVSRKVVAGETGIPGKYLSKILSDLVRVGLLDSTRGTGGGFWMAKPSHEITLYEAVAQFETFDRQRCPFGNIMCRDESPCAVHEGWSAVVEAQQEFLKSTSIREVAMPAEDAPHRE